MELHVNPHRLILIGENSFIRLSSDGGQSSSTRCSHWRVLWSPRGAGHALFVDSEASDGVRVYADSVDLARFLQEEIECLLHEPFADTSVPVTNASFDRGGTPPGECSEIARTSDGEVHMLWSSFLDPFNFAADPGFDGRPLGVATTFFRSSRRPIFLNSLYVMPQREPLDELGLNPPIRHSRHRHLARVCLGRIRNCPRQPLP